MPPAIAESGPLSIVSRVKGAAKVLTGKASINPLSVEPKDRPRAELCKELNQWCVMEREFWKNIFDRIKQEQKFAAGKQWPKEYKTHVENLDPYIGDVVQQMVNRKTATLYSKNPTPEASVREMMYFTKWDGNQASIDGARATVQAAQQLKAQAQVLVKNGMPVPPPPPEAERQVADAQAIVADYEQGMMRKALLEKIAETATRLLKKEWEGQQPDILTSGKSLVTQVITSRVGYIKVMYRREGQSPNTVTATQNGLPDDMEALQRAHTRMQEPDFDPQSAEAEKFKLLQQTTIDLQSPNVIQPDDEGTVLDFLPATSVIVDRGCKDLTNFTGCKRIAHEMLMSVEDCETKFNISLNGAGAVLYADDGTYDVKTLNSKYKPSDNEKQAKNRTKVCVWEIQDKPTGSVYVVCDGVKDFLKEPEPNEPSLKRFWTIVAVTFNRQCVEVNDPENDVTCYPRSDIRLAMPMQIDMNQAGEGLREHRTANRPFWLGVRAKFAGNTGESDLLKMASPRPAHTVLMIDSLNPGEKALDFLQAGPMMPIDPKMYDPTPSSLAMMQATGMQASDIGQQRPNEKATGQNIAAQQKATTDGSNVDDLDLAYSTVSQMQWEMLIQEMPKAVVQKKVGAGAIWPDVPEVRTKLMNEIFFQIEAGSSGRPNQLQEVENFKVIAPQLAQYMIANGYDLEPLIKEGVRRMNDKLDIDDFLKIKSPQGAPGGKQPMKESLSMKLSDLSPQERAQALTKAGIQPGGEVPQNHAPQMPGTAAPQQAAPKKPTKVAGGLFQRARPLAQR